MSTPNVAVIGTVSMHLPAGATGTMMTATGHPVNISGGGTPCLVGDILNCSQDGPQPIISGGSVITKINGTPIAIKGSVAACGAVLVSGFAPILSVT
jgi:uncharacterized Zn-binding protein involved in type VI secretion